MPRARRITQHRLKRPFEVYEEDHEVQRVLELDVKCTQEGTMDVTDLDLRPIDGFDTVPVTQRRRAE